jgi:predicted nucleic acid-binding protein
VVTAVNLAEVVDVLVRRYGQSPESVNEKLDWLIAGGLDVVEADEVMGRTAGRLRAERYTRAGAAISLGDGFAAAAAVLLEARLATADPALASVARAEGVEVVGLPDSAGRRP